VQGNGHDLDRSASASHSGGLLDYRSERALRQDGFRCLSRKAVAAFMLDAIEQKKHVRKSSASRNNDGRAALILRFASCAQRQRANTVINAARTCQAGRMPQLRLSRRAHAARRITTRYDAGWPELVCESRSSVCRDAHHLGTPS